MCKNKHSNGLLGERSNPPTLFLLSYIQCDRLPLLENFTAAARGIPAATDSRAMT